MKNQKLTIEQWGHLHKDYDEIFEISLKQQEEIERLNNIINKLEKLLKEVREYINNHQLVFEMSSKKQIAYWFDMFYKELLDILDKVD